jgi:hypothetical protein
MHAPPTPLVAALAALTLLAFSPGAGAQDAAPETPAAAPAPPAIGPSTEALIAARHALTPSDALWAIVRDGLDVPEGAPLGYTSDEMAFYGRDRFASRVVQNLFRDVRTLPRFTGRTSASIVEAAQAGDTAGALRWAFLMLDVSAARNVSPPPAQQSGQRNAPWGVPWLDTPRLLEGEDAGPLDPADALRLVLTRLEAAPTAGQRAQLDTLRPEVQRLIVRMLLADLRARPWIDAAFDNGAIADAAGERLLRAGASPLAIWTFNDTYDALVAPFAQEPPANEHGEPDSIPAAVNVVGSTDLTHLSYGALLYHTLAAHAVEEFRAWRFASGWSPDSVPASFTGVRLATAHGVVRILGTGDDLIDIGRPAPLERIAAEGGTSEPRGCMLIIDLGGMDTYRGRPATTGTAGLASGGTRLDAQLSTIVDLDGDDTYAADGERVSIAAAMLGVASIYELAGDDTYQGGESSISRALHGVSLIADYAGDDRYENDGFFSQAAAHVGVAMLIDTAGRDAYTTDAFGQALGGTRGAGIIVDLEGNDEYTARDDGNVQSIYWSRSVSMAQGVGFGRRADYGDGNTMAGGVGALIDVRGDDTYHASVWAQGAAYWWALGFLEDWHGNDTYRNGWYATAGAAHFGAATAVDLSGNDTYNLANEDAVTQHHAAARDGSVVFAIDGAGDDVYQVRSRSLGSADLGSIAGFWDRAGNDEYRVDLVGDNPERPLPYRADAPLGGTTTYPPFRSYRDDLLTLAFFIDSAGEDRYLWQDGPAGQGKAWDQSRSEQERAVGFDLPIRAADDEDEGQQGGN